MTAIIVLVGLLALGGAWVVLTTNTFIRARNKVDEAWRGIDVQLRAATTSSRTWSRPSRATPRTRTRPSSR